MSSCVDNNMTLLSPATVGFLEQNNDSDVGTP